MHFALISAALLASSALAAPTAKRDNVQTASPVLSAGLVLSQPKGAWRPRWVSFQSGDRDGDGYRYLEARYDGEDAPKEVFNFIPVKSNALGSEDTQSGCQALGDSGVVQCFGLLQSKRTPSRCIGASKLDASGAHFAALPCVYSDDDAIKRFAFVVTATPQTFATVDNNFGPVNYTSVVTFLGDTSADGSTPNKYTIKPYGSNLEVQLNYGEESSGYEFIMTDKIGSYYPLTEP